MVLIYNLTNTKSFFFSFSLFNVVIKVELNHFLLLRSVGKGAFGKVRVVQHKKTEQVYALKYINKVKCMKMKAVDNIIQERRLLEEIHHPFVW